MLSYLQKANRSVHHIVLTPGETNPVADRALLRAMKQVYGPDGEPKRHSLHGFLINTPMEDDELMTTPVLKWITPGDVLKAMTFEAKSLINKTKKFFNSNQIALWLHETDVPDAKCHARKGPHFHVIVESTTANSRNLKNFRALQTACSKYDCGMFVSKVNSTPDKVYLYQMQDSEKTFLGSNSAFCLENINALLHVDGQVDTFPESTDYDNMADPFAVLNPALVKGPQTGEKRPPPTDMPPRKRSKNIDNLYLLKRCIENNPDVSTLQEMVMLYKATEDYQQLADIFFDPKADKYWSMAQQECAATSQEADIFHRLDDLPDSLRHMLTPEQTLALFNAWCDEQSINAKALAWIIISCLQARVYKKIGVYLQGASNSGKTYWTSTLFHPMNKLVGKMTTGGRFCLQDCGKKRIIVGEEVGIGADNVDRLKELMSGETTTFERKMKAPGQCKANLVLLNSNNLPFANVPQERQALENRMFLFRNLKRSKILPTALKGMEATKPNPKFLRLIEPPTNEELQDLIGGIYPRQGKCSDNLGIVPTFTGDWKQWSDELSQNRKVLESDMAAPEFIIDLDGTLASQPVAQSPELFTPPCPDNLLNVRVETVWPFQEQPQSDEDLRDDLQYFFPTLSDQEIVPGTPQQTEMAQSDESVRMMDMVYEAYCAYEPEQIASQSVTFDKVEDENPWLKYNKRWPGASDWAVDNPAPSEYHHLQWSKTRGFYWDEQLAKMNERSFSAVRFVMDCPKPKKRAKLVCRENGKWQWRLPAQDEDFFKHPSPKDCAVEYLELKTGVFEENVHNEPIDAWSTEDFYLDGSGFFVHKQCDKTHGTDIKYILLKNGVWDIVTKTRVPSINREGKVVKSITVNAAKYLNFFPSDDAPDACAPQMMPVWLPRSFVNTQPTWTEDDQDTIADLFYLIVGYTQPFKARVYNIGPGPIHKWTDISDCYPDLVQEMEQEAQCSAKKIIDGSAVQDMVDGAVDQPQKRSIKIIKFLTKFVETAAATVAMVVTLMKIWDEIF